MIALLFSMTIAATDPALEAALQRALTREPARVELTSWDAPRNGRTPVSAS